jgi:hypothetical protein
MTTVRQYSLAAVIAVVCLAGAYSAGRYAAPTKVVVTERVVTVEKQVVVTTVDTDRILNAMKDVKVQKDVHTVRVVEKEPDGTMKVTTTKDDKSKVDTDTKIQDQSHTTETKTETKTVYQDREVTKLVEHLRRPTWSLAVQPGYEVGSVLGLGSQPYSLLSALPVRHLMANVVVEHRLIGGLYVGAWASTHLDGGLSLRLEF